MTSRTQRRNLATEPQMFDVRTVAERDEALSNRIAVALRCASDCAASGDKIPAYLAKAALRFDAQLERAGVIVLVLRFVEEAAGAGHTVNGAAKDGSQSAFQVAADRLGLQAEAVQKIYYANRARMLEQFPAIAKTRKKPR